MPSLEDPSTYVAAQQKGIQGWGNSLISTWLWRSSRPLSGKKVLEIGGSSGELFDFFLERGKFKPQEYVILDPNCGETQPDLMKSLKSDHNVKFVRGSAEDMPFENGAFDVILSSCVLAHVGKPEKALNEVLRVLRPGGEAFIAMPSDPGLANCLIKSLITFPRMKKLGVENPRLEYARSHIHPIGNLLSFAGHVFGGQSVTLDHFPTRLPVTGLNLFVGLKLEHVSRT